MSGLMLTRRCNAISRTARPNVLQPDLGLLNRTGKEVPTGGACLYGVGGLLLQDNRSDVRRERRGSWDCDFKDNLACGKQG